MKFKSVFKKRMVLTLILFLFIPQIYVVFDCLNKSPCDYEYKFNVTFMILGKLLPSLFSDFFTPVVFLFLIVISLVVSFFIASLLFRERKKF